MMDILIRGISPAAVHRLDEQAAESGLSRNEFLRRKIEQDGEIPIHRPITPADWARTAETYADLTDESVLQEAWQ